MPVLPVTEVFTRADAVHLGWSDASLSRAVRSGRLVRVRRGLFTAPGTDAVRAQALAVGLGISGAVLSHRTALLLHGLPLVGPPPRGPELTVSPTGRGSVAGALLHRAALPDDDVVVLPDGTAATSVARTLVDVARSRPTAAEVAAIDAALHRHLVTLDDLDAVRLRCWNWPSIRRAHRALTLCDGRAESPLESVSRLVIGWLRLPPPELQRVVLDEHGREVGRLDFYWDEPGVAGEADGRSKYASRDVLTAEKARQEDVENLDLPVVRWGWSDVVSRPGRLRTRIERTFERGRRRDRSGLPRQWSLTPLPPTTGGEDVINTAATRRLEGRT